MNTEAPQPGVAELLWTKSSYSGGNGGECIEVAVRPDAVFVRDSKNRRGPRLAFGRAEWSEFVRFASKL